MKRPSILDCTSEEEWNDWFSRALEAAKGKIVKGDINPSNVIKQYCVDCTPAYFDIMARKGMCFQAKFQNDEISYDEVMSSLNKSVNSKKVGWSI